MNPVVIKQGEGKFLRFSVTRNGTAVNLSSATLRFVLKAKYSDAEYLIEKADSDFDRSNEDGGFVRVNLSPSETSRLNPRNYLGELEIVFVSDSDVDKSVTIPVTLLPSVTHD